MLLKIILFFHVSQASFLLSIKKNTRAVFYFGNTMNTATQKVPSIINYHQTKIKIHWKAMKLSFLEEQKLEHNKNSHHLFFGCCEEFKHFPKKQKINVWDVEDKGFKSPNTTTSRTKICMPKQNKKDKLWSTYSHKAKPVIMWGHCELQCTEHTTPSPFHTWKIGSIGSMQRLSTWWQKTANSLKVTA